MKPYTIERYQETEFGIYITEFLIRNDLKIKHFNDKIGYGYITTRRILTGKLDPSLQYMISVATLISKVENRSRPDVVCEMIRILVK